MYDFRGMMADERYIFHVHTWRCGHAEQVEDEEYVKEAIRLGAKTIVFTDHAPFPGDPFTGRMKYDQLDNYIFWTTILKNSYSGRFHSDHGTINVVVGLEIEYLPSFIDYYKELRSNQYLDFLLLGQHHFEISPGNYSFQHPELKETNDLCYGLLNAQTDGLKTGLFDAVAHPGRCCRFYHKELDAGHTFSHLAELFYNCASRVNNGITALEINLSNWEKRNVVDADPNDCDIDSELWKLMPADFHNFLITGLDAHSIAQMRARYEIMQEVENERKVH